MDKSFIKFALISIIILLIIFTVQHIIKTYAVFQSEMYGVLKLENANWKITVNNTDITSKTIKEFNIDNFNIVNNSKVAEGKIAPNTEGYFTITIDPKDTDVSVKYEIIIDKTNIIDSGISIESVKEISNRPLVLTDEYTYTGIILLDEIRNSIKSTIKINITWENDEVNNETDTLLGTKANNKINIPIQLKVAQYMGEDITEYTQKEEIYD